MSPALLESLLGFKYSPLKISEPADFVGWLPVN
jgi:hypothetical protein